MKTGLLSRLRRLEETQVAQLDDFIEVQYGNLKHLPDRYVGLRHTVTVGRNADGTYEWEERPGPAPAAERDRGRHTVIQVNYFDKKPKLDQ